jgi:hypothetical protein
MSLSVELAVVLVTSILGLSGVIIAALLSRSKSVKWDGAEERRQAWTCSEHSGLVVSLQNIEMLLAELRSDRSEFTQGIQALRDSVQLLKDSVQVLRDSMFVLSHRVEEEERRVVP